jgi:hypothetical protein
MSLKVHSLHSHLNFLPKNLGAVSDEQGERFHQDISTMEKRYQGAWGPKYVGRLLLDVDKGFSRRCLQKKMLDEKNFIFKICCFILIIFTLSICLLIFIINPLF